MNIGIETYTSTLITSIRPFAGFLFVITFKP